MSNHKSLIKFFSAEINKCVIEGKVRLLTGTNNQDNYYDVNCSTQSVLGTENFLKKWLSICIILDLQIRIMVEIHFTSRLIMQTEMDKHTFGPEVMIQLKSEQYTKTAMIMMLL